MVNQGHKILSEQVVMEGSELVGATIADIEWPDHCLLVAIQRGMEELIPKGKTEIHMGDIIVAMTDERMASVVHEKLEELCREDI